MSRTTAPVILEIRDLHAGTQNKQILKGINLTIREGELHAIMGLNGAGKSTLSNVILGNPEYQVTSGEILYFGKSLLGLPVEERARAGIFLSFQYPVALPGISIGNLLKSSLQAINHGEPLPIREFRAKLKANMDLLKMPQEFLGRYVNDGFSGGEKKRCETLQMAMMEPRLSILDETDSGLDIDALRIVAEGIRKVKTASMSILLITHYQRMLQYLNVDYVHVLMNGQIVKSGGPDLAEDLEERGYEPILEEMARR